MATYKNVAFIPVRGGSKSIPLKNIKQLNGRPLIYWTIDAAIQSDKIDKVFVSTDSMEIKKVVESYDSDKVLVIGRSEETATDTASTESAMLEFAEKYHFENIVLIQATSPLLETKYLEEGIEKIMKQDANSVLSVVRQKRFIWKEQQGFALPINYDPQRRLRRQEMDGFLVENGAFYITKRQNLLRTKCRISESICTVEMPDYTYFELDEPTDWIIIEQILKDINRKKQISCYVDKIKMIITDCDGVLTDAGMYYSEYGDELKKFNTKDGMGFQLLKEKGYKTGIITGEKSDLVLRRAEKLKVDEIHVGVKDKIKILNEICKKYELSLDQIAYIGDDINDIEVISVVGFGCCVADGMESVKKVARYVTKAKGGEGAVREVAELLMSNI